MFKTRDMPTAFISDIVPQKEKKEKYYRMSESEHAKSLD